jgi:hypothetical protein
MAINTTFATNDSGSNSGDASGAGEFEQSEELTIDAGPAVKMSGNYLGFEGGVFQRNQEAELREAVRTGEIAEADVMRDPSIELTEELHNSNALERGVEVLTADNLQQAIDGNPALASNLEAVLSRDVDGNGIADIAQCGTDVNLAELNQLPPQHFEGEDVKREQAAGLSA